jgi:hypothetical protein
MYNKVQELALKIAKMESSFMNLTRKNKLLSYVSEYASDDLDSTSNSFHLALFEAYLNNLILNSKDITTLLVATHFNININSKLSIPAQRLVIFDISPKYKVEDWFSQTYISKISETLSQIRKVNLEYKIRVCDGFSTLGEIQWFDPYLDNKDMSVCWGYNSYTVRDFETTCRMCEMAKRAWSDYVYVV